MYFGEYERTVDYKGRLTVPANLLTSSEEADWSKVMVVKGEGPSLYVFDLKTFQTVLDEAYRSMDDDEVRLFMHRQLSDAHLTDVDNLKRITIPSSLLQHAGVDKRALIVGALTRWEVWNPETFNAYEETRADVPVPSIADLSRARIREVS